MDIFLAASEICKIIEMGSGRLGAPLAMVRGFEVDQQNSKDVTYKYKGNMITPDSMTLYLYI